MLIKKLDYITEFFLWVLAFGIILNNAPTEVASYWIIFLFLIKKIALRDIKFTKSSIGLLLGIFFVICLVSFLRSDYYKISLKGFSRVPKYIFLYFALTDFFIADKKRIIRFFWVLMAVSAVTFLNGIFQSIFGFDIFRHNVVSDSFFRITSSFCHPNDFGAYIATVLPLTFLFFENKIPSKLRTILLAIFLFGFFCLIRTSSRGAWIGFIIAMIFFFSIYRKKMLIFIPFVALTVVLLSPSGIYRVKGLLNPQKERESVGERMLLLKGTWAMVEAHPVLGSGINTFMKNFEKYRPQGCPQGFYAHNSYLQMWAEIGILGLLVFLMIPLIVLVKAFTRIKAKIKITPEGIIFLGSVTGYISFLVHSAVDNNLYSLVLTTLFWVFTAYIISLNSYLVKQNRK